MKKEVFISLIIALVLIVAVLLIFPDIKKIEKDEAVVESSIETEEKVYITNVVNYRPPENRKPTEDEIDRYYPYLKNHIEIINPKIIAVTKSIKIKSKDPITLGTPKLPKKEETPRTPRTL